MTDFTLDTFQTWLGQTIKMAVDARYAPGDVAIVLREEASRLSEDGMRLELPTTTCTSSRVVTRRLTRTRCWHR